MLPEWKRAAQEADDKHIEDDHQRRQTAENKRAVKHQVHLPQPVDQDGHGQGKGQRGIGYEHDTQCDQGQQRFGDAQAAWKAANP